jgi:type II secretory pathway pseudopilin PulG
MTYYSKNRGAAFTLVELLVVFAILGILGSLMLAVSSHLKKKALMSQEISAGKALTTGLALYAAENNNELLPGMDRTAGIIELPNGEPIGSQPAYRYPWRLAPYVGNTAEGTFVLDVNRDDLATPEVNSSKNAYHVSLMPALGYNGYMLGGVIHSQGDGTEKKRLFEDEVALRMSEAGVMNLIAFAGARSKRYPGDEGRKGNHLVIPPTAGLPGARPWISRDWDEEALSVEFGHLDLRHGEQAVVARLDGSTELLGPEELKDMRNWSLGAQEADDPQYPLSDR